MQTNILWRGREYYSLENCLVTITEKGSEINSVIIGSYQKKIFRVEYLIKTNLNWETIFFEIKSQHSDIKKHLSFESDGKGNWISDGKPVEQFNGCIDIDIPLTPFTNTLPINRLKIGKKEEKQIQVLYLDLLEHQTKPVRQKYIRLSESKYRFENVPNDFEAVIKVDELGLVIDYPALFIRKARVKSNYR